MIRSSDQQIDEPLKPRGNVEMLDKISELFDSPGAGAIDKTPSAALTGNADGLDLPLWPQGLKKQRTARSLTQLHDQLTLGQPVTIDSRNPLERLPMFKKLKVTSEQTQHRREVDRAAHRRGYIRKLVKQDLPTHRFKAEEIADAMKLRKTATIHDASYPKERERENKAEKQMAQLRLRIRAAGRQGVLRGTYTEQQYRDAHEPRARGPSFSSRSATLKPKTGQEQVQAGKSQTHESAQKATHSLPVLHLHRRSFHSSSLPLGPEWRVSNLSKDLLKLQQQHRLS